MNSHPIHPKFAMCFKNRPLIPSMVVINTICEHFDKMNEGYCLKRSSLAYSKIDFAGIRKKYRGKYHVMCRIFIAHYLYHYCDWTMEGIGVLFGGRDHSTISHGTQLLEDNILAQWDNEYKDHYSVLSHLMNRPKFPNYDIDFFYKKHNVVKVKIANSNRRVCRV